MAERIVSPGVFTREKDLSFLPQGISEIGAAIVGPTIQGPSFVPTVIRNFEEFEKVFGFTSYQLAYDLGKLQHLEEYGIDVKSRMRQ